jgi:outer membrane protein OmpA-like peptidoglycan-associated protein
MTIRNYPIAAWASALMLSTAMVDPAAAQVAPQPQAAAAGEAVQKALSDPRPASSLSLDELKGRLRAIKAAIDAAPQDQRAKLKQLLAAVRDELKNRRAGDDEEPKAQAAPTIAQAPAPGQSPGQKPVPFAAGAGPAQVPAGSALGQPPAPAALPKPPAQPSLAAVPQASEGAQRASGDARPAASLSTEELKARVRATKSAMDSVSKDQRGALKQQLEADKDELKRRRAADDEPATPGGPAIAPAPGTLQKPFAQATPPAPVGQQALPPVTQPAAQPPVPGIQQRPIAQPPASSGQPPLAPATQQAAQPPLPGVQTRPIGQPTLPPPAGQQPPTPGQQAAQPPQPGAQKPFPQPSLQPPAGQQALAPAPQAAQPPQPGGPQKPFPQPSLQPPVGQQALAPAPQAAQPPQPGGPQKPFPQPSLQPPAGQQALAPTTQQAAQQPGALPRPAAQPALQPSTGPQPMPAAPQAAPLPASVPVDGPTRQVLADARPSSTLSEPELRQRLDSLRLVLAQPDLPQETNRNLRHRLRADREELRGRVAGRDWAGGGGGLRQQPGGGFAPGQGGFPRGQQEAGFQQAPQGQFPGRLPPQTTGGLGQQGGFAPQSGFGQPGGFGQRAGQPGAFYDDRRPGRDLPPVELRQRADGYREAMLDASLAEEQRGRYRAALDADREELRARFQARREARRAELRARAGTPRPRVDVYISPNVTFAPRPSIEVAEVPQEAIEEQLAAPPQRRIDRRYTIEDVKRQGELRQAMPRVDLDTITFGFNEWTVREEELEDLEGIGRAIEHIVAARPNEVFLIEGHTDAAGSEEYNAELSQKRAEAVKQALVQYYVIAAENLQTVGYGEEFLKIQTPEPEEENRRVTLRRITPLVQQSQ